MQYTALDQAVAAGQLVELAAVGWQRRFGFRSGGIAYVIGYVPPSPKTDARTVYQAFFCRRDRFRST
jgi:hypothetical protein